MSDGKTKVDAALDVLVEIASNKEIEADTRVRAAVGVLDWHNANGGSG